MPGERQRQQVVALDPFNCLAVCQHKLAKERTFKREHSSFDNSNQAFDQLTQR